MNYKNIKKIKYPLKYYFWKFLDKVGPFLTVFLIYLLFSFIAWELNPLNWYISNVWWGRILYIIMFFGWIKATIEHYYDR